MSRLYGSAPHLYRAAPHLYRAPQVWETAEGECVVMMQSTLEKMHEKVDLTLLNRCAPHALARALAQPRI